MYESVSLLKRMSDLLDDLSPEDTVGFSNGARWIDVATVEEIRNAAYPSSPTLPIAVEGKAPEGWQLVPTELTEEMRDALMYFRQELGSTLLDNGAAIWGDLLNAAPVPPSSPGKDGGQEVEAVKPRALTCQCGNSITDPCIVCGKPKTLVTAEWAQKMAAREGDLDPTTGISSMPELRISLIARAIRQSLRSYGHKVAESTLPECIAVDVERALAASTQPASTALVERLTIALRKAEDVLAVYADPEGYADADGDQLPPDAEQHEGLLAQEALDVVRAALSSSHSTSRKGESR